MLKAIAAVTSALLVVCALIVLLKIPQPVSDSHQEPTATALAAKSALVGQSFLAVYSQGSFADQSVEFDFSGDDVRWTNSESKKSELDPVAVFDVTPEIRYFGYLTRRGYHAATVLDLSNMHVTTCGSDMNPRNLDMTTGSLALMGKGLHTPRPSPLAKLDLTHNPMSGMKVVNTFTSGGMGGNVYNFEFTRDSLTYLCVSGPNKGVGETCKASTIEIGHNIYLNSWTENLKPEGDGPFHGGIVYDFNTGRIYNSGSDGKDLYTSEGTVTKQD